MVIVPNGLTPCQALNRLFYNVKLAEEEWRGKLGPEERVDPDVTDEGAGAGSRKGFH